jgi:hypothetical protein
MCAGIHGRAGARKHGELGVFGVRFLMRLAFTRTGENLLGFHSMLSRVVFPADSLKVARIKGMGPLSRPPDRSLLLVAQTSLGAPRQTDLVRRYAESVCSGHWLPCMRSQVVARPGEKP